MPPFVYAIKDIFGGLFNSEDGKGGGIGNKPTPGASMQWEGKSLDWPSAFRLLTAEHAKIWVLPSGGNACKPVGKGVNKIQVQMSDEEQKFSDLKQMFNRIIRKRNDPNKPSRMFSQESYEKKSSKRHAAAEAVREGTADISQIKQHAVVVECTARNHNASFLAASIASVEGAGSATLADPFFAPAVNARGAVERELARRRIARVEEIKARHVDAISKGLIDATTLASFKLKMEISRILELNIGDTGLTLEELFHDHAVYFGFCSLSDHRLLKEESAFVTDTRRIPAFMHNDGTQISEEEFWALAKVETLFQSHVIALPARLIETELQTIFHDRRTRLWHNRGAGSWYNSARWIDVFTREQRTCTVFVTYVRKSDLQGVKFHSDLPLFAL